MVCRIQCLLLLGVCTHLFKVSSAVQYLANNQGHTSVPVGDMVSFPGTIDDVALAHNSITNILGSDFDQFPAIAIIDLSDNEIVSVSSSAFCSTVLSELNLNSNFLTAIPNLGCVRTTLTKLHITTNNISSISSGTFNGFTQLSVILLNSNHLTSVEGLAPLKPILVRLSVVSNDFKVINSDWQGFRKLDTLELSQNQIFHVEPGSFNGSTCRFLDMSHNNLTAFPDVNALGFNLIRLTLSHNNIRENVSGIVLTNLTGMFHLEMSHNGMMNFPYALCGVQSGFANVLRRLILANNAMVDVGPIGCTKLREISFNNNPIVEFPSLGPTAKLKFIQLDGTQITRASSVNMDYLKTVDKISILNGHLTNMDVLSAIFNLTSVLSELCLNYNNFTTIPESTFLVPTLTTLKLAYNNITCVPEPPLTTTVTSLRLVGNPLHCDCCNSWLYGDTGTVSVTLDPEPCKYPPNFIGVPWSTVKSHIDTNGCMVSTIRPSTSKTTFTTEVTETTADVITTPSSAQTSVETQPCTTSTIVEGATTQIAQSSQTSVNSPFTPTSMTTHPLASDHTESTAPAATITTTTTINHPTTLNLTPELSTTIEVLQPGFMVTLSWNAWIPWTACPNNCGGGLQIRWMVCDSVQSCNTNSPIHLLTGSDFAYSVDVRACPVQQCPVDGFWQQWAPWGDCSSTCGTGLKFRARGCVEPQYGGADGCDGKSRDHGICNTRECTVEDTRRRYKELTERPVYTKADTRVSNTSIGIFAILLTGMLILVLVIIDLPSIRRHVVTLMCRNIRRTSPEHSQLVHNYHDICHCD